MNSGMGIGSDNMDYAWAAFWLVCGVAVICYHAPKIIRARAEAKCQHKWEKMREGAVVKDMGRPTESRIGTYTLYRCDVCGAERDYR